MSRSRSRKGVTTLKLRYRATGEVLQWTVWRDPHLKPPAWCMKDEQGTERILEGTWRDTVPRLQLIAANHGCDIESDLKVLPPGARKTEPSPLPKVRGVDFETIVGHAYRQAEIGLQLAEANCEPKPTDEERRIYKRAFADGYKFCAEDRLFRELPQRDLPATNEIATFFHCATCMKDKPDDQSPREWARLEVGFTPLGIQVWCKRCECNVCHIDFQGMQHPANLNK